MTLTSLTLKTPAALAAAFLGLALAAPAARAADNVYWSIGVSPAPGVAVTAGNTPPPRVVYTPPQVVYAQPQVVYAPPAPSYYYAQSAPGFARPGAWHHGHRGHGHGRGHDGHHRH